LLCIFKVKKYNILIHIFQPINLSITLHSHLLWINVVREPKIYSHSKFPVHNTVSLIPTLEVHIRALDLLILRNWNFVPFDQ
jgi:hypothetical protein